MVSCSLRIFWSLRHCTGRLVGRALRVARKMRKVVARSGDRVTRQAPGGSRRQRLEQRSHSMDACPICAKHKGLVVGDPLYQDDLVYAHHAYEDQGESYLGYLRVETQRHVPSFAEL